MSGERDKNGTNETCTTGCIGNTIKTFSGGYIDLLDPSPKDIDIESIAHALANICRFGGHAPVRYSVAEHSLNCYKIAILQGDCADTLRAVLMHDAAEAYLGDIVKPLKNNLPDYRQIEERMEIVIGVRFGIDFDAHRDRVKKYDLMMLKCEKMKLWPSDQECWSGFESIPDTNMFMRYDDPKRSFLKACDRIGVR